MLICPPCPRPRYDETFILGKQLGLLREKLREGYLDKRRIERATDNGQVRVWWENIWIDLEEGLVETLESIVSALIIELRHL
jgi:hypothetical protein